MVKFRGRRNISSTLQSNFVAGAALGARYGQISWQAQHFQSFCACESGAVHILDRNVVFSCGASSSSISIILCVCACGSVRILDRKKFAVAQADTPFEEESGLQC